MQSGKSLEFGPFFFNPQERILLRQGQVVSLAPMVFDLLQYLIERHHQLCSKEELIRHLWPDTIVGENSLLQIIYLLRRSLGDESGAPRYILTVPRHGYRFVAELKESQLDAITHSSPAQPPVVPDATGEVDLPLPSANDTGPGLEEEKVEGTSRQQWTRVGAVIFIVVAVVATSSLWRLLQSQNNNKSESAFKTIAVLPFRSLSREDSSQSFSLGITDALIIRLSSVNKQVTVRPFNAVLKYEGKEYDPLQAGSDLRVEAVITGTVQTDSDHIRVTSQLFDVRSGRSLWSGTFEARANELFIVQDNLSEQLASSLAWKLNSQDRERLTRRDTADIEAYRLYRMAVYHWNKRTKESLEKAVSYLTKAVGIDPKFARAHALLADTLMLQVYFEFTDIDQQRTSLGEAGKAAEAAISSDETVVEAYVTLAALKVIRDADPEAANKLFLRALAIDPNNSFVKMRYGFFLRNIGRIDEAALYLRRALENDPTSSITNAMLGYVMLVKNDCQRSGEYLSRALELDPNNKWARSTRGVLFLMNKRYGEAVTEFQNLAAEDPGDKSVALYAALANALGGNTRRASEILVGVERTGEKSAQPLAPLAVIKAELYGALKQYDRAFILLNKIQPDVIDGHDATIKVDRMMLAFYLHFDPLLNTIQSDRRYESLIRRHPLPELTTTRVSAG
jgi:DNA-binding winged helix-turn-helix (wHTH) protein/TolB-like protein/Tfp pilus assembly protein PilF